MDLLSDWKRQRKEKKTVATWCAVMQINAKNDDNNIVQTYLLVIEFQRDKKNRARSCLIISPVEL